ncbi:DUF885 domain-containing protein [Mycetocola sp. JXN-3]|uniref:DUF885 domain-containing protein n=1 Tax=Mycetocola sp. JXN-3 TaxID=2116510 RepID=UPI00165D1CCF|nr:DUF885 domain-containing protein [Mycetocola sp. JXN-3]
MSENVSRPQTPIDRIAEAWVDTLVSLSPMTGTYIGRTEANEFVGDYSPAGLAAYRAAAAAVIEQLDDAEVQDKQDRVTLADLRGALQLDIEIHDAGLPLRDLNVIASPPQEIRDAFDLVPTETAEDWAIISRRLARVPAALAGYIETLRLGVEKGITPAKRQVIEVADQSDRNGATDGFFPSYIAAAGEAGAAVRAELEAGAEAAATAYRELAGFLRDELSPVATEVDAVGREAYSLFSRRFLGAEIDLDETYEWGIQELARMVAEQEAIADQILPGATVHEAIAHLEQDPNMKLHGVDALQKWMQETSDRAVAELGATQFDIPEEIRTLECMIAPTQEGGIYYTGPTDDFSRPGRMWWSVPQGVTEFDTWRELTTVYHEGVPGHHLQIGQAVYNRDQLNSWRRLLAGTSGHAEGWALYAERLMDDLGYLSTPADRLGMLDGQRMRAARVVLDIGVHLGKQRPDGQGVWTAEYAFEFLAQHVNMNEGFVHFEVNRYLGWAGQAPSYKVGQRIWEQLRDDYRAEAGESFDIRDFHREALGLGGVGLDTLRDALRAEK